MERGLHNYDSSYKAVLSWIVHSRDESPGKDNPFVNPEKDNDLEAKKVIVAARKYRNSKEVIPPLTDLE